MSQAAGKSRSTGKQSAKEDAKIKKPLTKKNDEIDEPKKAAVPDAPKEKMNKGADSKIPHSSSKIAKDAKTRKVSPKKKDNKTAKPASALDEILDPKLKKKSRQVVDGYTVYTEEELNLGKEGGGTRTSTLHVIAYGGKDTPDCPFDCKCCY